MTKIPKFVSIHGIGLRLVKDEYYRDGGQWRVKYKIANGELTSWLPEHP